MIAVLMMAHGTPDSLDQMEAYLTRVREGRPPSSGLLEEMTGNYAAIGGRSPLTELTRAQARALESTLGPPFRVFVGMRNWHPLIEDAVKELTEAGAEKCIGIPMAPQYSVLSVKKYLDEARRFVPEGLPLFLVQSWYDHPGLLEAFAEKVRLAIETGGSVDEVIFTAHSLPERVKDLAGPSSPPYPAQFEKTAEGVARRVGLERWSLAYQSAGRTSEPWLGPELGAVLAELAERGAGRVLVVPVGFVCDHTEILFDIDRQAKAAARELGMELVRTESLNTSPRFIAAVAEIVRSHVES
jgi:ferrochelatase